MKRKITVAALLSFFAWNALFGGVGGLLLCVNKSSMFYPELISSKGSDCPTLCIGGLTEESGFSDEDSCLDIELKAVELPHVCIDKGEPAPALTALHCAVSNVAELNFAFKEIAHIVQAQAPPDLLNTSVLVAQGVNLRL